MYRTSLKNRRMFKLNFTFIVTVHTRYWLQKEHFLFKTAKKTHKECGMCGLWGLLGTEVLAMVIPHKNSSITTTYCYHVGFRRCRFYQKGKKSYLSQLYIINFYIFFHAIVNCTYWAILQSYRLKCVCLTKNTPTILYPPCIYRFVFR